MGDGVYRTDDLALATTLALRGYEYEMVKLTQRKVVWDFTFAEDKEEDFHDTVSDFWEFCAAVEPRAFTLRWAEMRRELFRLVPPTRHPVQPAQAAAQ